MLRAVPTALNEWLGYATYEPSGTSQSTISPYRVLHRIPNQNHPIRGKNPIASQKTTNAARAHLGWKKALGNWILFTDSDCIPHKQWIEGYFEAINGSLGYAGIVRAYGSDIVSQYYESQKILVPPPFQYKGITYPEFLITANALVWKSALEEIRGFNEEIQIAAGEDVDLGFRLREVGNISYAPDSLIYHNFDDGLNGFMRRFIRYGEGNKKIADLYQLDMKPKPFKPVKKTLLHYFLAWFQYYCLYKGYTTK